MQKNKPKGVSGLSEMHFEPFLINRRRMLVFVANKIRRKEKAFASKNL
jgi:hypothetical protein